MFSLAQNCLRPQGNWNFQDNISIDPALETMRLNLERRKSVVNAAAHRYGCVPPWDDSLQRLERLELYLTENDPLAVRAYRGQINFLLGKVEQAKVEGLRKLINPLYWPSLFLSWLLVPILRAITPALGKAASHVFEGFAKQIGVFLVGVVIALLFWPHSGHALFDVLIQYAKQQLTPK